MPGVTSTVRSGDQSIDGLLAELRWAGGALTYSFPTSGSQYTGYGPGGEPYDRFGALNATQRSAVHTILDDYSAVANLNFSLTSGGTGDLRFGMTGGTDAPAHAYLPSSHPTGGDTWYDSSNSNFAFPIAGSYGYFAFIHEIGHALGLKHPHEGENFGAMTSAHDSMPYTVMSYRSSSSPLASSQGYTNETYGYAQGPMLYDIAALQHMYGARYDAVPKDTVYSWSPANGQLTVNGNERAAPGANRIFTTVWDGGGTDTYDFSDYADGLKVDLRPGMWTLTSPVQRVNLGGNLSAPGNIANAFLYRDDVRSLIENAIGGSGNDRLIGNDGDNGLNGGAGADEMTGGLGDDTYWIDHAGDLAVERAGQGADTIVSSFDHVLSTPFEHLQLAGAAIRATGNGVANTIDGNGENNFLDGRGGADVMRGGGGNDIYIVDHGGDVAFEAKDFGGGIDMVRSPVSFTLRAYVEKLTLLGDANLSGTGNAAVNLLLGNGGANVLRGLAGDDVIRGGEGADRIYGGAQKDLLSGGGGADRFYFDTQLHKFYNVDRLGDFSCADDTICLDDLVFQSLATGQLNADAFHLGAAAADAEDRIIYNSQTGDLFFDADGIGSAEAVRFATIAKGLELAPVDFLVY
jgi:serralysin